MPKHSNGVKFNIESIKDADLRAYVRQLSTLLDKQNQELKFQSIERDLYQKYFQFDDLEALLNEIVKVLPIAVCSSLRILVSRHTGLRGQKLTIGKNGSETDEYAYLDGQIIQQLKSKKQLIVSDTAKIHSIKFDSDKKYPKTICAYQFLQSKNIQGCFWIAYESVKEFSTFELQIFQRIASSLERIINRMVKMEDLYQQVEIDKRALDLIEIPVAIIGHDKKIIGSNYPDTGQLQKWVGEICTSKEFSDWEELEQDELHFEMQIEGQHYQITVKKNVAFDSKAFILILDNDSTIFGKEAYLKMIMGTISHDFRVPLINTQGFAKLLSMVGDLNEKQAEYLASIAENTENLLAVIEDLVDINRLDSDGAIKVVGCEPGELIDSAIALMQAEARQKRIEFEVITDTGEEPILVDKVLVISALYNLLKNAVVNSRIGGTVFVEGKIVDNNWTVSVKDQGKGISRIDIEKLEANHFVLKAAKGLSIVDKIARFHKGRLSVESELGRGSTFIFEIPGRGGC